MTRYLDLASCKNLQCSASPAIMQQKHVAASEKVVDSYDHDLKAYAEIFASILIFIHICSG